MGYDYAGVNYNTAHWARLTGNHWAGRQTTKINISVSALLCVHLPRSTVVFAFLECKLESPSVHPTVKSASL